jgi:hypothetical protein
MGILFSFLAVVVNFFPGDFVQTKSLSYFWLHLIFLHASMPVHLHIPMQNSDWISRKWQQPGLAPYGREWCDSTKSWVFMEKKYSEYSLCYFLRCTNNYPPTHVLRWLREGLLFSFSLTIHSLNEWWQDNAVSSVILIWLIKNRNQQLSHTSIFWDITHAVHWKSTDILKEHVASIFRVKE